jgi:hypothetical protein
MANGEQPTQPDQDNSPPDETFNFLDPKTKKQLDLPKNVGDINLQGLIGNVIEKSKTDASRENKKLKSDLEALRLQIEDVSTSKEDLLAKIQEFEDAKLSQEEQAQKKAQREIEKYQKSVAEMQKTADQYKALFEQKSIDTDIYGSIGSHDVFNPEQAMIFFKNRFKPYLVQNENGMYETKVKIPIDGIEEELNVKEAFDKFIAMPENQNLLKNNLQPGGGTSTEGGRKSADGGLEYSRKDLQTNPKLMTEYKTKLKNRENVRIVN